MKHGGYKWHYHLMNDPYSSEDREDQGEQERIKETGDDFHALREAHDSEVLPE